MARPDPRTGPRPRPSPRAAVGPPGNVRRAQFKERNRPDGGQQDRPASVLVRVPNWVGDACLAMPFFQALREALPGAHIAALARPHTAGIARLAPVDEVIELDDQGPLWIRPWRLRRAGVRLRARRFEAAITLPTTTSAALLMRMAGIRRTVGYGRGGARYLLSDVLDWKPARSMHRSSAYLGLLAGLSLPVPELVWDPPPVAEAARAAGARRLDALGRPERRVVGLGIGSAAPSRRWPVASFAALAARLAAAHGAGVVLLGGPADRETGAEVSRLALEAGAGPDDVLDLTGQTALEEMPGLLACLDLVVANDSGAAHLAALARVPSIVLFGAGDARITAPLAPECRVVTHPVHCSPCLSNRCRHNLECLTGIGPERIVAEARPLLERPAGGPAAVARSGSGSGTGTTARGPGATGGTGGRA
jgi:heptosyltransferase-2